MKKMVGTEAPLPDGGMQSPSVRTVLAWLVLACFVPGLLGCITLLLRDYHTDREQLQQRTLQTARALVQTVDAQLAQAQLLALALAMSGKLNRREFEGFHKRAKVLLDESDFAQTVVIYDAEGQQLINTRVPYGQALPRRKNIQQIQNVFSSGKPVTSEVFPNPLDGSPVVSVAVPVYDGPQVAFALAVGIAPKRFNELLNVQNLPNEWDVGIMDNTGTVAARSHLPEKYVGQKAAPELLDHVRQVPEAAFERINREGMDSVSMFSTSQRTGWTVAIDIPKTSFYAPLIRTLLWLALGAALLLLVSIVLARYWGGRITGAVGALHRHVMAIANGQSLAVQNLQIKEANEVARALANAATLLEERTQALVETHGVLVKREAELADAQRIAGIGSWSWDVETDVTHSSKEVCAIFGLREIPVFAHQSGVMFPHEAWLELRQARLAMARTGVGYNLELPAFRSDGAALWVNTRAEVVRNADGLVTGLSGTVQDITERKQSESIAHSERFIRAITNAMPSLVAYWDTSLHCKFANQSYLDWWNKTEQALKDVTLKELMGESLFQVNEPFIRAALNGEEQHFERFLTKPDGSVGHVLAQYLPDRDQHGKVQGFIIIVSDIKAVKLAEAELKLAANVYQNTSEAIMVTDLDGSILSVNPAFTRITGYPAQEAIGQTPRLLRSARHDADFYTSMWRQISDQGQWRGEVWNRRKNGEVYLEWQTITRIAGSSNESSRYVCVFHDITDTLQSNGNRHHQVFQSTMNGQSR